MEQKTLSQPDILLVDEHIVDWTGPQDLQKPSNWSTVRKWTIVVTSTMLTFVVSFSSSVYSSTIPDVMAEFNISRTVAILGLVLYVLSFGIGPMIWGPASEMSGRTRVLWFGTLGFCIFQVPIAVASNVQTLMLARFFAGLFGSAALAVVAGMYVDFLNPVERGVSTGIYSAGVFCGPIVGPIAGTAISEQLGWRWTAWITLILGGSLGILSYLTTPESAEWVILRRRARSLRLSTRNWALHAKCEESKADWSVFAVKYLSRPIKMIFLEPVLVAFTAYMSFVYGILYLTLTLYPYAFQSVRKMSPGDASMQFFGLLIGILVACVLITLHSIYVIGKLQLAGVKLQPEHRLHPVILGSILLPAGLFWFAWTYEPSTAPLLQAASGVFIGCGIILVFMSSNLFLIEVYLTHVNSALAINTFARSVTAAAFPLFSGEMLSSLGVKWTGSLLGFVSIALAAFPILMMLFGPKIRGMSKFAMKYGP